MRWDDDREGCGSDNILRGPAGIIRAVINVSFR